MLSFSPILLGPCNIAQWTTLAIFQLLVCIPERNASALNAVPKIWIRLAHKSIPHITCNPLDKYFFFDSRKQPTWRTVLFCICLFRYSTCFDQTCPHHQETQFCQYNSFLYMFISIFYMFRSNMCSSSGDSILSVRLAYVTPYRWPPGMQIWMELQFHPYLHTGRPPTYSDIGKMSYWYNWVSRWWTYGCSKHLEYRNKHIQKRIVLTKLSLLMTSIWLIETCRVSK